MPISAFRAGKTTRTPVKVCRDTLANVRLTGTGKFKRGTRIGDASAAGNRVAWIEERCDRGAASITVAPPPSS